VISELHEGDYVCLCAIPGTIFRVVDWETELIEVPRYANEPRVYRNGETFVECKHVLGPPLSLEESLRYFRGGKHSDRINLRDLDEPNPMLVIALEASLPKV
jgi:hypothetical protein